MASKDTLKIDVDAIKTVAGSIEACSRDMTDIIELMGNIERKASKDWNASTSGKFITQCRNLRTDSEQLNESMGRRSKDLMDIAERYDELKNIIQIKVNILNPKDVFPNAT